MSENGNGAARWQLYLAASALLFSTVAFFVWIGTIQADVRANQGAIIEQKASVLMLTQEVSAQRNQLSVICADLVEVETQFKASDQVRNLMHTNDLRIQAMLWNKIFMGIYPVGDPYLPTIAQDQPTPCR